MYARSGITLVGQPKQLVRRRPARDLVAEVPGKARVAIGSGLVGLLRAILQVLAQIAIDRRRIRRRDRVALRIVLAVFAERIEIRALVAGVQAAGGGLFFELQVLRELPARDPQVRLHQHRHRQPGVAVQLLRQLLLARRGQLTALQQPGHVVAQRELLHLGEERLERRRLARQLLVVEGRRRVGRQRQRIGLVGARVEPRRIGAVVKAENLRQQNDAVQIHILQRRAQHRRPGGPVALTKQVLGRVPAVVLGQEFADEPFKGVRILVDAPEGLVVVLADRSG